MQPFPVLFPSPSTKIGRLTVIALLGGVSLAGCSRRAEKAEEDPDSAAAREPIDAEKAAGEGQAARADSDLETSLKTENEGTPPAVIELSGPAIISKIRDSKAKFTLLNFWASWCGPCRREFPMLIGMRDNLSAQGLDILFVSLDEPDSLPVAVEFAQQNQLELPIYNAKRPVSELKAAVHPGWPGMLPASFLFDADGNLKYFWGGPVYEHELLPVVEKALAGEDVQGEMRFGLSAGKDLRNE